MTVEIDDGRVIPARIQKARIRKEEGHFLYIHCPYCDEKVLDPFSRLAPIGYHQHRTPAEKGRWEGCGKRFVHNFDPIGDDHVLYLLKHNESYESVLIEIYHHGRTFDRFLAVILRVNKFGKIEEPQCRATA